MSDSRLSFSDNIANQLGFISEHINKFNRFLMIIRIVTAMVTNNLNQNLRYISRSFVSIVIIKPGMIVHNINAVHKKYKEKKKRNYTITFDLTYWINATVWNTATSTTSTASANTRSNSLR